MYQKNLGFVYFLVCFCPGLAYELIAQINDSSAGWMVQGLNGELEEAQLFDDEADREQYLGLYIRYSQIANEYHNIDNWFGYGLYKSLFPLARGEFDNSIQGAIAEEAYNRLFTQGFDEKKLAAALEVEKNHSDEILYEDPYLVTRLCNAAYEYLSQFGIKYILIALDELETAAEAATYGLDSQDIKHLDGKAIKLMGKAIKEEDPRRKLPWLRYVALCSPAIGDELREIQSTARRFEIVELANNAFADVSDFVRTLEEEGKLTENYPPGLVEAAYAMSGGNFGWFNVIMANVDEILRNRRTRGSNELPTVASIFDEAGEVSQRIGQYVLDRNAIKELKLDRTYLPAAKQLLYGQLPVPITEWDNKILNALLDAVNEYDEPICLRYRRVEWDELECSQALRNAKFTRDRDCWQLGGIDEPLDLSQLLANLSTYAIHESQNQTGKQTLLIPLQRNEFIQLVKLLYPHNASEDAARALWKHFIGEGNLELEKATHIGCSIAMLGRLNIRYRQQNQNSLIFRDPDSNSAYEQAIKQEQTPEQKHRQALTGLMRILDNNWDYNPVNTGLQDDIVAISTARGRNGGLVSYNALKLHPQGRLILAWVNNIQDLESLCRQVSSQFTEEGKTPVLAFTSSRSLVDLFNNPSSDILKNAHNYLLLYQLSDSEEFILHQVGIPTSDCIGFKLDRNSFTTAFSNRINFLLRPLEIEIKQWRKQLHQRGLIAYPLRPAGKLREEERKLLYEAWRYLAIKLEDSNSLTQLLTCETIDVESVGDILGKLDLTVQAKSEGYDLDERAYLFDSLDENARAVFPAFLVQILDRLLLQNQSWTMEAAKREWFWGYTWEKAKPNDIFIEWMTLACEIEFAKNELIPGSKNKQYVLQTRSELNNLIQEAENWLNDDYPQIINDLALVFGEGKVRDYFDPKKGTKTLTAKSLIEDSKKHISKLETLEINLDRNSAIDTQRSILKQSARLRLELIQAVEKVYLRDRYKDLDFNENINTLNFEDDTQPLWSRIGRAELFAQKVREVETRIRDRIISLQTEMRTEVQDLDYFPLNLFTLSLEKIGNILDGALHTSTPQGSTGQKQQTEPGTLGQYLKDLQVTNAIDKLAKLAQEVGIELDSNNEIPLEDIEGYIIRGFLRLKKAYQQLDRRLSDTQSQLTKLEQILDNPPDNFKYPAYIPSISDLLKKISYIEDALASIQEEEAEDLRDDPTYDKPAKFGNFKPLMDEAVNTLLKEPKRQLDSLSGHVVTIENAIAAYYKFLLNDPNLQTSDTGLNALLKIKKQPPDRPLTLNNLETVGNLQKAIAFKEKHYQECREKTKELLKGTGVSCDRWQTIVKAIEAGKDPKLDPKEADNLVNKGFLVRTYRLGE
ncbi:MAG: hypothetical protein Tsb0014_35680 [Pleurocapsa sp.]